MTAEVKTLRPVETVINTECLELLEESISRVRAGETTSLAIVEVQKGGNVATCFHCSGQYHQLNSGAARLAARLASEQSDP